MAEIHGILRPELQALPQIADRMTFLLFPAHAGVIPGHTVSLPGLCAIPRTRGGDPGTHILLSVLGGYSPHTRR